MSEVIRYRPDSAVRWLQTSAEAIRKSAAERGRSVMGQTGTDQKKFVDNVRTAAGAIFDFGKSAYTDRVHQSAQASEYVLLKDHFDIVKGGSIKTVPYDRVKAVELHSDKGVLTLDRGHLTIHPIAFLSAGSAKVPLGWQRNGMDAPFELLIEEISARAGLTMTKRS